MNLISTILIACLCLGSNEINIEDKPLNQVIDLVRTGSKTNIVVKWKTLESAGIEKDDKVNIKLHDVSWGKFLSLVLDQVSDDVELAYMIDDEGVVIISTKADLSKQTKVKVYDVRDLLVNVPNFRGPKIDITNIGQGQGQAGGIGGGRFIEGSGGGGTSGQGGIFSEGDEEEESNTTIDQLVDLIRATIDPDTWRSSGGNTGDISVLTPQIVVTQTTSGHNQLRDL